jgi:hypothetical protein
METTGKKIEVDRAALNALEKRGLTINAQIHRLLRLLEAGDVDRAKSLAWLLQEANSKQIHGLVAAGAVDSIAANRSPSSSTVWDDDDAPVDADRLDLGTLRSEFGPKD